MSETDHLDVGPGAVHHAGGRTAARSSDWSDWAGRSQGRLRDVATNARSTKVGGAFETYLSQLGPTVRNLATRTEALGGNARTGATVVDDADQQGDGLLRPHTDQGGQQAAQLNRPINGPW